MKTISGATRRRYGAALLSLLGLVTLWICMLQHSCICGYLKHGQNVRLAALVDVIWIICLPAAAVLTASSTIYGRSILSVCLVFLSISNALSIAGKTAWYAPYQYAISLSFLIAIIGTVLGLILGKETRFGKKPRRIDGGGPC